MAHAALRSYPDLRDVPQRWVLVDAAPKILPEIPRRLGEYASRRLERRGIEIHVGTTLESYDGDEAVLANGDAHPGAHARVDGRRPREPAPRRARPPARRARARRRRRDAARRGLERHLGARRLRRGDELQDAGRRRPADLPARAPPGTPAREEPDRRRRSRTATACSARSRRSGASRGSRRSRASTSGASPAGSSRGRTTCTSSRCSRGSSASSSTGRSRSSSAATSSSSRCSAIREELGDG